jgi:hypothetical protein
LGLWIWSTEFRFARRLFEKFKLTARAAWAHAERHPVSSAAITLSGLAGAAGVAWAVSYFELVSRGKRRRRPVARDVGAVFVARRDQRL